MSFAHSFATQFFGDDPPSGSSNRFYLIALMPYCPALRYPAISGRLTSPVQTITNGSKLVFFLSPAIGETPMI
jgi:hypothetical protein